MPTIFTKIIAGEIPCHKLAEDEHFLSFLDVFPIAVGHALVIPKKEVDYIFDLDDETMAGLMNFAKPVAKALEAEVPCKKIGVMVAGLEVAHAHIHLVPMNEITDLSFAVKDNAPDHDKLAALAERVRNRLS